MTSDDAHPFGALATLAELSTAEARRVSFRGALADLAATIADRRAQAPLEGIDARGLEAGIDAGLRDGFFDALDWLAPDLAYPAVYEIASVLPPGDAKRALGRMVLQVLRSGRPNTFVAIATQLVLSSSSKWLQDPSMRARVVLALDVQLDVSSRVDALALALVSRRELVHDWLTAPSMGALASRRLAAKLLERASREAARRARAGDDSGARVFDTPLVRSALERLLADRESLVWRHVAIARGQLSLALPRSHAAILADLDPALSITEWRRGAVALAASAVVRPAEAFANCFKLLDSPLPARDPGTCAELVHGLACVAAIDPSTVADLLAKVLALGGLDAIEALVSVARPLLEHERLHAIFDDAAARLDAFDVGDDEGRVALVAALRRAIGNARFGTGPSSLAERVEQAVDALVLEGAAVATRLAAEVVAEAGTILDALEELDFRERTGRIHSFAWLRDVDAALLETDACASLLLLEARPDAQGEALAPLVAVLDRLHAWFAAHEAGASPGEALPAPERFLRIRRLRTLLHLVDAEGSHLHAGDELVRERRAAWLRALQARVASDASSLHRVLCATAARVLDAMVREGAADVVDAIVTTSAIARDDLHVMAEASMVPEVETTLRTFGDVAQDGPAHDAERVRRAAGAARRLAKALPVASSTRVEAFRSALLRYAESLESLGSIGSLHQLLDRDTDEALQGLVESTWQIALLVGSSQRRLGRPAGMEPGVLAILRDLRGTCAAIVQGRAERGVLVPDAVDDPLPPFVVEGCLAFFRLLAALPFDAPRRYTQRFSLAPVESALPAWMPLHRTLGGFFVERALGGGSVGTVFVARRVEDRLVDDAEQFALKVPDYDASAARTLSEAQFLTLFQEEAAALLLLPRHPNIARFVTFDAGARPKPMLVMELVHGHSLERVMETRRLSTARIFELLDGLANGLEAMHAAGLGHLDLKPSNVIVRTGEGDATPVLVDLGLAGRKVRAGCGTPNYGAVEVWYSKPDEEHPAPPADAYAFGCLAYELFTGLTLFDADDPMEIVRLHARHDGWPEPLLALARHPELVRLAEILSGALRRKAEIRSTIPELRRALAALRPSLEASRWPLAS